MIMKLGVVTMVTVQQWVINAPKKAWNALGQLEVNGRTLLLVLSGVLGFYIFHMYMLYSYSAYSSVTYWENETNSNTYSVPTKEYLVDECHLPDLDPFDPIVMKCKKPYPLLHCEKQPYLTFIDDQGFLHINDTAVELLKHITNVSCVYYPVTRKEEDDDSIRVWKNQTLQQGVPVKLDVDVVKVVCLADNKTVIYHDTLTFVRDLTEELRRRNTILVKEERPSILMIGFDSTSRLNFIRQLPKSYRFLTETLNIVVLKGHTKSAINTKPNMFAFLSGVTYEEETTEVPGPFFYTGNGGKDWSGRFDLKPAPVWWNTIRNQGYISMTLDDSTGHATYNIQPTDYYAMPYYYALDLGDMAEEDVTDSWVPPIHGSDYLGNDTFKCKGNTPVYELHFRYVEDFVQKARGQVYFALSFLVRYSHNDFNSIQLVDDYLAAMLQRMLTAGDLDNTVLMVFSDHGNRFGDIFDTPFGDVEKNMPMMSVYLPPKLKTSKPHLQAGLESNSERLLGWFDMHELVMDLVMDNLEPESRVTRWAHNGLSPFRDIPRNRTCYDVGIPPNYCVCLQPTTIDIDDPSVKIAAEFLLRQVNELLSSKHPTCAVLRLRSVESAEVLSHEGDPVKMLRVGFKADPSDAHLQGIVKIRPNVGDMIMVGRVERIDRYGSQSHCIQPEEESILKLYCLCQD